MKKSIKGTSPNIFQKIKSIDTLFSKKISHTHDFQFLIYFVFLFLSGCITAPTPVQPLKIENEKPKTPIYYRYELSIVDINNNPLEGVNVEFDIKIFDQVVRSGSYITKADGIVKESELRKEVDRYTHSMLGTEFLFKAKKRGYYTKNESISCTYGESYWAKDTILKKKTMLIKPIDYFDKTFALSVSDANLKKRILNFIDLIILKSFIVDSALEMQSINLVSFKSKKYLQFKLTNMNDYNSLKMNKYDIGKQLYDDVVRKILSPLNEYIGGSNMFYGYDLIVIGHTKNFAEKTSTAKSIEYRFLIPESIVRKYKNKDISGQQVLDASIILMDDERIELKLQ